ncbi:DEAD/DEAH box helicase [Methanolobus halotolerans]|uniref:ATP-dependent helicase n=1 Tax=Methanolobus halotolerans TaxID=2052935 RepID=A0A4E0Q842_9EURY|nr:DEAD/DEAH box helicase [Methanolobus halotolerans]TGC07515.1 ATP-dependent helicase [Methanolobus halotolerans]
MKVPELINRIRSSRRYEEQIAHIEDIPAREPAFGSVELKPMISYALNEKGINQLYVHQAEAVQKVREGKNIVLSTSTASGKSLCYMLPVFESMLDDQKATALYISPLNALVNDQLRSFRDFAHLMGQNIRIEKFIGTMSQQEKNDVKYGNPRIVFTNPDMLHLSFLGWKHQWRGFLANLRFIVLDESHSYSGVMGSHMANLLRRLNRVCEYYGSKPQYICCTATIGNPVEHTSALIGKDVCLVDNDSSGRGAQKFVFWNPPFYARSDNFTIRRSSFGETVDLFTTFVQGGFQTIVFARSRQKVERMYVEARNMLTNRGVECSISSYRGGYYGEEREVIEKQLSKGSIEGVISTNALELGIDIGGLDACIMDGFPGTIMSARQQAGRAGRGNNESIVVLVADSNALDQYYMRNPGDFFRRECEEAVINVSNRYIQAGHLLCAAMEIPLRPEDALHFGSEYNTIVRVLEEEGLLQGYVAKQCLDTDPHRKVSIRNIDNDAFTMLEKDIRKPIEKNLTRLQAYREAFEGAVYINKGIPYCVTKQDHKRKEILVEQARDGYYTRAMVSSDIVIKGTVHNKFLPACGDVKVGFGDVDVTQQVTGYRKVQQRTDKDLGQHTLRMPTFTLQTEALWIELPGRFTEAVEVHGSDFAGGIHAIEHAMIAMYPLHLLADRNDIGGVSTPEHPDLEGKSAIFVYDGHQGGVGYAEGGYEVISDMLEVTLKSIESCPCTEGCPGCIQSPKCGNNNNPLDKDAAIIILRKMLGRSDHVPAKKKNSLNPGKVKSAPAGMEGGGNETREKRFDPVSALDRARRKLRQKRSRSVGEWVHDGISTGRDKKDHAAAYECFEAALQLEPDNALAIMNKGITCMYLHRYQMALECFNRLISMGHRQGSVWTQKGVALYYMGDYRNAVAAYDEALKVKPADSKLLELRKRAEKKM